MAAINIQTDFSQVNEDILAALKQVRDPEYLLRPVAQEQIRLMHDRIHEQGLASDGSAIGSYKNSYMKIREGKYKRTADTKVIISLTRQLENDYGVIVTEGGYGVGFNSGSSPVPDPVDSKKKLISNYDKAGYVETHFGKKIFDMTKDELDAAIEFLNELTEDAINP